MKNRLWASLILSLVFLPGCIGISPPHVVQMKPYTLIRGGDQLGRDQLANRFMVAQLKVPIKGLASNDVLSYLGQPQQVEVLKKDISEDWHYIYYRNYKSLPRTSEGTFVVRFYDGKVFDVVSPKQRTALQA